MSKVLGLHHITALSSDPQATVDFYSGILGLRLVKKTVNYDAPNVYHLYFANYKGDPGTILTFFPYVGLPKGKKGSSQLTVTSFSVSKNALKHWMRRLDAHNIAYTMPKSRFDGEEYIYFEDFDGLGLELVANTNDTKESVAIKGFYGITLCEEASEKTAKFLQEQLGYIFVDQQENRFRYTLDNPFGNQYVDILCNPESLEAVAGAGTVHHVAFATENDSTQLQIRENLLKSGYDVTPVLDRNYFHSIYFREPGGVLFEVATMPPGFTVDEKLEELGEALTLPKWLEPHRKMIEKRLMPIN